MTSRKDQRDGNSSQVLPHFKRRCRIGSSAYRIQLNEGEGNKKAKLDLIRADYVPQLTRHFRGLACFQIWFKTRFIPIESIHSRIPSTSRRYWSSVMNEVEAGQKPHSQWTGILHLPPALVCWNWLLQCNHSTCFFLSSIKTSLNSKKD